MRMSSVAANIFIAAADVVMPVVRGATHGNSSWLWIRFLRRQELLPDNATEALRGLRSDQCALVGNSGILKKTAFGPDIDRHACVARINQASLVSPAESEGLLWSVPRKR